MWLCLNALFTMVIPYTPDRSEPPVAPVRQFDSSAATAHLTPDTHAADTSYDSTKPMTNAAAAAGVTVGHRLLHHEPENGDEANIADNGTEVPNSTAFRLYTSHFLSTWNSRLFEFGAALFLTSVFPGTLLPVSIYSLVRNAGYIVFAQPLGNWINRGNRLDIIRTSIVGQRIPVAASCALLLVLELKGSRLGYRKDDGIFAVIVLLAVVEKVCSTMNTISVERDWVGEMTMPRVDLFADHWTRSLSSLRGMK